jgi:hypothetical protein
MGKLQDGVKTDGREKSAVFDEGRKKNIIFFK